MAQCFEDVTPLFSDFIFASENNVANLIAVLFSLARCKIFSLFLILLRSFIFQYNIPEGRYLICILGNLLVLSAFEVLFFKCFVKFWFAIASNDSFLYFLSSFLKIYYDVCYTSLICPF